MLLLCLQGCVEDVVLQHEGRLVFPSTSVPDNTTVTATLRLRGGKGGFGSMLRAIGAQIEKTTNREACRDLSGRRLRDINEEKRLKDFISKKAEREREMMEKRKQKFQALKNTPKHMFQDESYFHQREEIEKKLHDSLEKAFAGTSGNDSGPSGIKRTSSALKDETTVKIKRRRFLDDLDESSSDEDSDSEAEEAVAVAREGNSSSTSDGDDSRPLPENKDNAVSSDESSGQVVPTDIEVKLEDKHDASPKAKQVVPESTQVAPEDKQSCTSSTSDDDTTLKNSQ